MNLSPMRRIAAILMTLSGMSHIAALWMHDITPAVMVNVLFGAIYLFIGIGLFGQSRFALFTAIVFPGLGATLGLMTYELSSFSTLGLIQLAVDFIVIAICAIVLFSVRNNPSV